jgi:diguanylate cyclase (GGDEF)-like protein
MNYYLSQEARFRMIEIGTLIAAALVSTLIGFLFALYYGDLQRRFRQLFYRATRDELTGLLNHHRANELVDETLNGNSANCAMLLVSIDHPKMLIARHGHCVADAVIADAANVLRKGFDKNLLARIGEGEFIVFVEDCDLPQAKDIARSILTDLSQNHAPIAGVTFSVSIGIAVSDGTANFASLCSDAEAALYSVRVEGNGPIGVANESRLKKDIVLAS